MEALKTGLLRVIGVLAIVGWGLYLWELRKPIPAPRIETKVEYRDRIVNKETVRTVKKPDGTVIVTQTNLKTQEKTAKQSAVQTLPTRQPQYSLGLGVRASHFGIGQRAYDVQLGYRIGELPLWQTITISTDRSIMLGFRIEF